MDNKSKIIGFVIIGWLFLSSIVAMWTDRSLEWILTVIKGQHVDVPFFVSWLITFVMNGIILAVNLVIELIRLVF